MFKAWGLGSGSWLQGLDLVGAISGRPVYQGWTVFGGYRDNHIALEATACMVGS